MISELPFIVLTLLFAKHYLVEHYWCSSVSRSVSRRDITNVTLHKYVAKHLLLSLFVYGLITTSYFWLFLALFIEAVVRYSTEYSRASLIYMFKWSSDIDNHYWKLHGLTTLIYSVMYVTSIFLLANYSPQGIRGGFW